MRATLEWATRSPPPSYNFARIPVVTGANPLWEEPDALPVASGLRVDRRELVISTVAEARPRGARMPRRGNSIWPLFDRDCHDRDADLVDLHALGGGVGLDPDRRRADRLVLAEGHAGG